MKNLKEYLIAHLDHWMAPAYGIGKAFSYAIFTGIGIVILARYGVNVNHWVFQLLFVVGGLGTYYYGVRSYEKEVSDKKRDSNYQFVTKNSGVDSYGRTN